MSDLDTHDRFERLMADEPAHRPLPDLVRAGEQRLLRRRLGAGAGALTVVAVAGLGAVVLPHHDTPTARDHGRYAGASAAGSSSTPTPSDDGPEGPAAYTYESGPGCGGQFVGCDRYRFEVAGVRDSVVAAVEYRLIDGSSKRVAAVDGEYRLVMTGPLPAGDRFDTGRGLVDAHGNDVDLFDGLTLYAADGSVLATATSTNSDQLDAYPEYCDLLEKDQTCVRP